MNKILYVSSSRADYGIVKTMLNKLSSTSELDLLITGSHLETELGFTANMIDKTVFEKIYYVPMKINDTRNSNLIKGTNILQTELANIYDQKQYNLVIILGDRFEMLPVAYVTCMYNVKICHLHGGELTLGNYDEQIRHALSKLSTLHLCSTEKYAKRVRQMGEAYVYNIGSLSIEHLSCKNQPKVKRLVVMYHPETLSSLAENQNNVRQLIEALEVLKSDYEIVYIKGNIDTNAFVIEKPLYHFFNDNQYPIYSSLEQEEYFDLLASSTAIIGNSSSGIIEAPSLKTPTINLGRRQEGRIKASSVIDLAFDSSLIIGAIKDLNLKDIDFNNPYYRANASDNAVEVINEFLSIENRENRFIDYE